MPGHEKTLRWTRGPALPGVDPAERQVRRAVWARHQDDRRMAALSSGRLNFVGALLILMVALVLSFSASTNALERAALAQESRVAPQEQPVVRTVSGTASAEASWVRS